MVRKEQGEIQRGKTLREIETMEKADIDETNGRKFRGRKLILDWGKMKLEISKLPYKGTIKDPTFDLFGCPVLLANVYEDENGQLVDEVLGPPLGVNGHVEGYRIENYASDDVFWCTPKEAQSGLLNDI